MAPTNTRELLVRILGDSTNLRRATADSDAAFAKNDLSLKSLAGTIGTTYAAKKVIDFSKASIDAAGADEAAQVKLAGTLRNTTGARDSDIAAVESWITKTMFAKGISDDELRPALSRLVTATHDVGDAQDLMGLAMDVSVGKGKSLQSVADALAKAEDGNTAALGRLGVQTKDAEGKTLSFDEIVRNLAETFDGQAAAAADTQAGKLQIMKLRYGELQEEIGAALVPVMEQLVGMLSAVAEWFSSLDEDTQQWIVRIGLLGGGLVITARAVNGITTALKTFGIIGKTAGIDTSTALKGVGTSAVVAETEILATNTAMSTLSMTAKMSMGLIATAMVGVALAQTGLLDGVKKSALGWEEMREIMIANSDALKAAGIDLDDLDHKLFTGEVSAQQFEEFIRAAGGSMNEFTLSSGITVTMLGHVAGSGRELAELFTGPLRKALGLTSGGLDETTVSGRELAELMTGPMTQAFQTADAGIEANNRKLKEAQDRYSAVALGVQSWMDAESALYDAQRSHISDAMAYEVAVDNTQTAMEELVTTIASGVGGLEAIDDASRDAAAAIIAQSEAYVLMNGAQLNTKEGTRLQIEELYKLASQMDPSNPLRARLLGYIAELQSIPKVVDSQLRLKITGANVTIGGDLISSLSGVGGPRAAGGPSHRGYMHEILEGGHSEILEEAGRFYLMAGRDGHVTPLPAAGSYGIGSGRGGVSIGSIKVEVIGTHLTPDQLESRIAAGVTAGVTDAAERLLAGTRP